MALGISSPPAPFDVLIVFGYGPVEARGNGARLNLYGRLNTLTAGVLYTTGRAKRLLLTGGRTGGAALPPEAELMARTLGRTFGVPPSALRLEPCAQDTLDNLALSAALLDAQPALPQRLGFLALELHLPRIRLLAERIGLAGRTLAAEPLFAARSARHARFLEALKAAPSYRALLSSQKRAMRGLAEMPDYWLPPLAALPDARLERIRRREDVQTFCRTRGLGADTVTAFRTSLHLLPRRFPEPRPEDGA